MSPLSSGARVCIGLSVPGIIFLIVIGILFDKQGFYTSVDVDDPSAAASDCYFAGEDRIHPTTVPVAGYLISHVEASYHDATGPKELKKAGKK